MKILHLVSCDLNSGAGRGVYWLHNALCKLGIDSKILTSFNNTRIDSSVIYLPQSFWKKLKKRFLYKLINSTLNLYKNRKKIMFNVGFDGDDFTQHPAYLAADIIHLHWINGLVSIRIIQKVDKPIVWTIRDMWPMTGGCHYSLNCERYKIGCGKCPQLGSNNLYDLSHLVVKRKCAAYPKQLRVVGISKWLSECAQNSQIFNKISVQTISNNIDTDAFLPIAKDIAREALSLDRKGQIVLVGALYFDDFYKGFDLFQKSLQFLKKEKLHFLFFGKVLNSELDKLGIEYTNLGILSDMVSLRLAYSAADVFVAPSKMEAFGKMLAEAMSCETPVVCFDATGPIDIVNHKITGYKARPFEADDLANGITWVLEQPADINKQLCLNARKRVVEHFDSLVIAQKYIKLYQELI